MSPITVYSHTSEKHLVQHRKIEFNTPREWQKYYLSRMKKIQHLSAKGMYFKRISDDIDLKQYNDDQITYGSTCYITPKTKIVLLPYGTFIWIKNTGIQGGTNPKSINS